MENFVRFAVYFAPRPGAFADFAAHWLGWDPQQGCQRPHPQIAGLPHPVADLTGAPRKYGFHGTLKPPFRLASGTTARQLDAALATLASRLAAVQMDGLELRQIGRFLALTPEGDQHALNALAESVVTALDSFRAPAPAEETARRMAAGLSPRQQALLERWGYPFVLEEFRFHLTLTGRLAPAEAPIVAQALRPVLAPLLPRPFRLDDLCLFGADGAGWFHLIRRYPLTG